jgi:hypothetical protein
LNFEVDPNPKEPGSEEAIAGFDPIYDSFSKRQPCNKNLKRNTSEEKKIEREP